MFRPPKPTSRANKLFPALFPNPTNASPLNQLASTSNMQLKMIVRNGQRSSSKETAKYTINVATRKTQDSQTILNDNNEVNSVSPNNQLLDVVENRQLVSPPSLFKIRQLSSQSKRSKENIEPNTNKSFELRTPRLIQDCTPKQFLCQDPVGNIINQSDTLIAHPLQNSLGLICSKTGFMKLNKQEKSNNKLSFIISECLFQQGLDEQLGMLKLKNICQQLKRSCPQSLIILKIYGSKTSALRREKIEEHKIKINYLIWDQQTTSSVSVYNLSKLALEQNSTNFIILSDLSSPVLDLYFCGIGSQYLYFKVNGQRSLINLINSFNLEFRNRTIIEGDQMNFKNDVTINYAKCDSISNQTKNIMNNNRVIQLIKMEKMKENMSKEIKATHTRSKSTQKQIQKLQGGDGNAQFDQIYKNKLVQLVKLLNLEQNGNNNTCNNVQYIKLTPHQKISQLMECIISTNTPFQIAGQIVKNNGFNYQQIKDFRDSLKIKQL